MVGMLGQWIQRNGNQTVQLRPMYIKEGWLDEGTTVEEYLGVKIDHGKDRSSRIYQPHLEQRIIKAIPGMENANKISRAGREQLVYGLNMKLDKSRGLEEFVDASFAGDWRRVWSEESSSANCPIIWTLKLQTEIALSTTEAEYIVLSHAMREAIPLMRLLNKIKGSININMDEKVEFKCTVFEDNNGCIELAECPRMRPRTKHNATKYHHFRNKVEDGSIRIERICTNDQQGNLHTKNLSRNQFLKLRRLICGH
eukprot:12673204-Ditylum_brightwellii.AAC.1